MAIPTSDELIDQLCMGLNLDEYGRIDEIVIILRAGEPARVSFHKVLDETHGMTFVDLTLAHVGRRRP